MDFGTGRPLDDVATAEALTGTPLYLAPEVLDGAAATVQSDLYSLGVLLFHLATGSFPVTGTSLAELGPLTRRAAVHVFETNDQTCQALPTQSIARCRHDRSVDQPAPLNLSNCCPNTHGRAPGLS